MTETLLEHLRASRSAPQALKIAVSNVRSRDRDSPIFIFEGDTDLGAYGAWIRQLPIAIDYLPVPGKGKPQLLSFRESLARDLNDLRKGVYFFVDRDFDDLRGQVGGRDVYCTVRYSIENYFVSEGVVKSLLQEEFKLAEHLDALAAALHCFRQALTHYLEAIVEPNRRIFFGVRSGVLSGSLPESVKRLCQIELDSVQLVCDQRALETHIPWREEVAPEAKEELDIQFLELSALDRYRGRFHLQFMLEWLDLVAVERQKASGGKLGPPCRLTYSRSQMSTRTLASRCPPPEGLLEFLVGVAAAPAV